MLHKTLPALSLVGHPQALRFRRSITPQNPTSTSRARLGSGTEGASILKMPVLRLKSPMSLPWVRLRSFHELLLMKLPD